jgi:hypothetical protein
MQIYHAASTSETEKKRPILFLEEEALKNSYGSIQILTDSVTHL